MSKLERSNERNKFTEGELRKAVAASKTFQNTPEGRRAAAETETRAARCRKTPTKFPGLSKQGTRPAASTLSAADEMLFAKIGII